MIKTRLRRNKLTRLHQPSTKQTLFYNKERMRILLRKLQMLNPQLLEEWQLVLRCSSMEIVDKEVNKQLDMLTLEELNLRKPHSRCLSDEQS